MLIEAVRENLIHYGALPFQPTPLPFSIGRKRLENEHYTVPNLANQTDTQSKGYYLSFYNYKSPKEAYIPSHQAYH